MLWLRLLKLERLIPEPRNVQLSDRQGHLGQLRPLFVSRQLGTSRTTDIIRSNRVAKANRHPVLLGFYLLTIHGEAAEKVAQADIGRCFLVIELIVVRIGILA